MYVYYICVCVCVFVKHWKSLITSKSEKLVGFNFCVTKTLLRNNYFWSQISKHFSPGIHRWF